MPGRAGPAPATTRWLFGDQLGPHFLDDHDGPVLLVESRRVFARKAFHRQKAHLVLSPMRHRASELGRRVTYARVDRYRDALARVGDPIQVIQPTSRAEVELVRGLAEEREIERLSARGYVTTREDFEAWSASGGRRRLLMEDFYRDARRRHAVLMDGTEPVGGRWNLDGENREPSPKDQPTLGVPDPRWPQEDNIDAEVRAASTGGSATATCGSSEPIAHGSSPRRGPRRSRRSTTSSGTGSPTSGRTRTRSSPATRGWPTPCCPVLNLGLLDPLEVVEAVEHAYRRGDVPLQSAEGFVRQVMGWRDYVWHLYWHLGENYRTANRLNARRHLPDWWRDLDGGATDAVCLSRTLNEIRDHGWVHHIPRLMVLGNYAAQRGWRPDELTDWYHRAFVDGYDWVMVPNVVGMSQHADLGVLATNRTSPAVPTSTG